jgi:hypothetical protein
MADAVFAARDEGARGHSSAEAVTRTAVAALAALAAGGDGSRSSTRTVEVLPVPEASLDVDDVLDELAPREVGPGERAAALVRFAEPLQRSAQAALRTSGDRARTVLDALGIGEGELAPFVGPGETGPAAEKARAITATLQPSILPLTRHPDPSIRARAIVLVAHSPGDAAVEAVVAGLEDSNETVQRVALAAVGATHAGAARVPASGRAVDAVGRILAAHDSWAIRVLAAQALGRLAGSEAAKRLSEAAGADAYALVRQAALEALASFDAEGAYVLAKRMAANDPEPRVREAARALARQ